MRSDLPAALTVAAAFDKVLQFAIRNFSFHEAAIQANHQIRKRQNRGLLQIIEFREVDIDLALIRPLVARLARPAGHSTLLLEERPTRRKSQNGFRVNRSSTTTATMAPRRPDPLTVVG